MKQSLLFWTALNCTSLPNSLPCDSLRLVAAVSAVFISCIWSACVYICGNTAGPQKGIASNYDECSGSGSGSFTILIQHGTATAYAAKGWLKTK